MIFDCIDLAEQAPSGGNDASRRWIVIKDEATKRKLGEIYARNGEFMINVADRLEGSGHGKEKVFSSSAYLVENFAKAPALVIAAIWGIHDNSGRPGLFDSVIQSGGASTSHCVRAASAARGQPCSTRVSTNSPASSASPTASPRS